MKKNHYLLFIFIVLGGLAWANYSTVYTTPAISYWPESFGATYRRVPCELCGEAISVSVPSENSWTYCNATASLPIADYESSYCVSAWEFSLSHDLCDECALLANEKIKKPLVAKHDEVWKNLVKIKAEEKAEREVIRRGLHIKNTKNKIADLQERLKELEEGESK
jgi:predicted CopG family antitoxin